MNDVSEPVSCVSHIKVGVVGATGYTGIELLKWLFSHPNVEVAVVTARQWVGQKIADALPVLRACLPSSQKSLSFVTPDDPKLKQVDVVFFATPHGVAMNRVPELLEAGVKVVDLSADFRLKAPEIWQAWYQSPHSAVDVLDQAVYGLAEWFAEDIASAQLVANPGCYPTSIQLALWPLIQQGLIELSPIVVDAKSGVSGAGRQANVDLLAAEVTGNFKAYGVAGHRHQPEIVQGLQGCADKESDVRLTFVPHLLPMARGIESSIYVRLKAGVDVAQAHSVLDTAYLDASFVSVLPLGKVPQVKWVAGTNHCQIGLAQPKGGDMLIISSVIDNLVKGAAGQAIQNMNLMMGWPETLGLSVQPSWP